eukprot:13311408-Alexandrium_andersonii.AAC.1
MLASGGCARLGRLCRACCLVPGWTRLQLSPRAPPAFAPCWRGWMPASGEHARLGRLCVACWLGGLCSHLPL